MLEVLLESRARRPQRKGGAALSVAVHVAIVGAATAATIHSKTPVPERAAVVIIRFVPPSPAPAPARNEGPTSSTQSARTALKPVRDISIPTLPAHSLPVIEPAHGQSIDSVVIGPATAGGADRRDYLLDVGAHSDRDGQFRGAELLMRIVASARPRYPEALRQAGVGGRVLIRFTVDTAGRIDMKSVQVIESTDPLFTAAVQEALPAYSFKPSQVGGRRVSSLAEMPFVFSIAK